MECCGCFIGQQYMRPNKGIPNFFVIVFVKALFISLDSSKYVRSIGHWFTLNKCLKNLKH